MSDNGPPTSGAQMLPPPPSSAGAPGYDNNQGVSSHMPPPPLAPVIIPQNTNPIPTAMTSPMVGSNGEVLSPDSQGGFVRRAAPEPNKRALYVGGLDPRVTEDVLRQIFETTGHVQNVKIIPDKNVGAVSPPPASPARCHCSCPIHFVLPSLHPHLCQTNYKLLHLFH